MGECFFWYRPTQVVPDKRPLNGCVCLCVWDTGYHTVCVCVCVCDCVCVDFAGVFYIESMTGVIRNRVDLAGLVDVYELVVQAADHGSPQLSNTAFVTINVLSTELVPPRWITPPTDDYVQYVREVRFHVTFGQVT